MIHFRRAPGRSRLPLAQPACAALIGALASVTPVADAQTRAPGLWSVASRPSLVIGAQGQPADHMLRGFSALAVGSDGSIWVDQLEGGPPPASSIRVFDSTGRLVRTLRGFSLVILGSDDRGVLVRDAGNQRSTLFSLDGRRIGTFPYPRDSQISRITKLRDGRELVVITESPRQLTQPGPVPVIRAIVRRAGSREGDTLAVFARDRGWNSGSARGGMWLTLGFGDGGAVASFGDTLVAVVDGRAGILKWFLAAASGLTLFRVDTLTAPLAVTPADIEEATERISRSAVGTGGGPGTGAPVRLADVPEYWSVADRAMFAPDGELWVRRPSRGTAPQSWWVLRPDGTRNEIALPLGFALQAIHGGRLYGSYNVSGRAAWEVRVYEVRR